MAYKLKLNKNSIPKTNNMNYAAEESHTLFFIPFIVLKSCLLLGYLH